MYKQYNNSHPHLTDQPQIHHHYLQSTTKEKWHFIARLAVSDPHVPLIILDSTAQNSSSDNEDLYSDEEEDYQNSLKDDKFYEELKYHVPPPNPLLPKTLASTNEPLRSGGPFCFLYPRYIYIYIYIGN